jgi:hypothetical protein
MKIEKLNETFICDSLGEMDIFIVRSSNISYVKEGDFILDKSSINMNTKTIEEYLINIESMYNYDKELIEKDIDRFLYRQDSPDNSSAYIFLKRLWRDNKINKLVK